MESYFVKLKKGCSNVIKTQGQAVIELAVSISLLVALVVGLAHLNLLNYRALKSYQLFRNLSN